MKRSVRILSGIRGYIILALIIGVIYVGWRATFHYVGLFPYCNISIREDVLSYDQGSIKSVIKDLKRTNPSAYTDLCQYTELIQEDICMGGDQRGDPDYIRPEFYGCYVKGTKVIYLESARMLGAKPYRQWAAALPYLARVNAEFWQSLDRY